jgi:hypothetical protein
METVDCSDLVQRQVEVDRGNTRGLVFAFKVQIENSILIDIFSCIEQLLLQT